MTDPEVIDQVIEHLSKGGRQTVAVVVRTNWHHADLMHRIADRVPDVNIEKQRNGLYVAGEVRLMYLRPGMNVCGVRFDHLLITDAAWGDLNRRNLAELASRMRVGTRPSELT